MDEWRVGVTDGWKDRENEGETDGRREEGMGGWMDERVDA